MRKVLSNEYPPKQIFKDAEKVGRALSEIEHATEFKEDAEVGRHHEPVLDRKQVPSILVSFAIHLALLLALACISLPAESIGGVFSLLTASGSTDADDSLANFDLEAADTGLATTSNEATYEMTLDASDAAAERDLESLVESVRPSLELSGPAPSLMEKVNGIAEALKSQPVKRRRISRLIPTMSEKGTYVEGPLPTDPRKGVTQSASVESAVGGLFGKLKDGLSNSVPGTEGPIWFIWIMDSSLSLVEERQKLAPLVLGFYESLGAEYGKEKPFHSSVWAFGKGLRPVQARNFRDPQVVSEAIESLPIDESGFENVMTAVVQVAANVPNHPKPSRIDIVVWTDESGDDLGLLEDVIQLCRYRGIRVHVVGPLSVFGMEGGLQVFHMPKPPNHTLLLPVNRGPDSAFPERAQLPLWYESRDTDWGGEEIIEASGPNDLGGPHRKRLLASTGPYSLTRLALATGGSFTALRREGDLSYAMEGRFENYLPDYRSGYEIASDIDHYPLRRAIIEAAALTGTVSYYPPRLDFPSAGLLTFPYRRYVSYFSPRDFQLQLRAQLGNEFSSMTKSQSMIDEAIQIMLLKDTAASSSSQSGSIITPFPSEFEHPSQYLVEESPRWRAWYDLNLGRLLVHSVRIHEYVNTFPKLTTNEARNEQIEAGLNVLRLEPGKPVSENYESVHRTKIAIQLLNKVIKDHPDSPWSALAKWELATDFGVKAELDEMEKPKRVRASGRTERPKIPRL